MGMLTVSLLCLRFLSRFRGDFCPYAAEVGAIFAPLPQDGRGFQPVFVIARFSTSFAAKQSFAVCSLKAQLCAQTASICAQMGGEQVRPKEPGRVLDIISLSERNIKS
jgi:hypothetical protein